MESAECPECLSMGPHHVFDDGRQLECTTCRTEFDSAAWTDLQRRRQEAADRLAASRARWQELADELAAILRRIWLAQGRSARWTEYRRRTRTRTRSRR